YFNNTLFDAVVCPKPMGPTLKNEYPQVEEMVRIGGYRDVLVKKGNNWIQDHHLAFADSTFFRVFTVPMIAGDPMTALNEPHSIVIDESAARRYFNSTDVIGKSLELENHTLCKVTGVFKDFPRQSHFHLSFIQPVRDAGHGDDGEWLSNNWVSYLLLKPGVTREAMQAHVDAVTDKYVGGQLLQYLHASFKDLAHQGNYFKYHLMPLTDIHLHSNKSYEFEANGNIAYVYVFSVIAVLILLIACVNFMNLSTARSAGRAKEVGIRKVAGSTRGHLITQFLTESVLLSLFSLVLALGVAAALVPLFNQLAGKELEAYMLFSARLLPVLLLLVVVVGCLAGSYPAFYLSSFQPIMVLKGRIAAGFRSSWLRSSLVVFQFIISIGLIISTIVIYRQLSYIRSRSIGFDRQQVVVIHNAYTMGDPVQTFRKELVRLSGVSDATLSGDLPTTEAGFSQNGWFPDASLDAKRVIVLSTIWVDEHYIPTLGMQMAQGRNFDPADFPTDSSGIILNEAAIRLLQLKQPLGSMLYRPGDSLRGSRPFHIIGVVKDFNYSSMRQTVGPMVISLGDNRGSMAIRLRSGDPSGLVREVEAKWQSMAQGAPFSYTFLDNDFDHLYHADQQTGRLIITFAVFAILIACLGLFGLVTYAAEQRTKEIGIRKVLGARVGGIVTLLSKDFTRLVIIASLIAFPLAWWAMNRWLQGFAYRTGISWWIFLVAGGLAVVIALVTVSFQTIRAAVANPVRSLRSE
ncbi:MAG TPA: FtsX-like permease family protein, partial [Puia sp.]|nr:FtsX-like permease family protein [Puia sp.]